MLRLERGKYAPAETFHETRAMSRTILPGGIVKCEIGEIGDMVLSLSPYEDRNLADLNVLLDKFIQSLYKFSGTLQ